MHMPVLSAKQGYEFGKRMHPDQLARLPRCVVAFAKLLFPREGKQLHAVRWRNGIIYKWLNQNDLRTAGEGIRTLDLSFTKAVLYH